MAGHSIDLDLLNTGHGLQQRKMQGDLRREVLAVLERVGTEKGVRYTEVAKALNEQSSIPIEAAELTSVIKVGQTSALLSFMKLQAETQGAIAFLQALEQEGQIAVRGTHDKRTIRKLIS